MDPQIFSELTEIATDPGTDLVVNEAEHLVYFAFEHGRPRKDISEDKLRALAADPEAFRKAVEAYDSYWIDEMGQRSLAFFALGYLFARDPLKVTRMIARTDAGYREMLESK